MLVYLMLGILFIVKKKRHLGVTVHVCDPDTLGDRDAGGSQVLAQLGKFSDLGRPCVKIKFL